MRLAGTPASEIVETLWLAPPELARRTEQMIARMTGPIPAATFPDRARPRYRIALFSCML
jgi:hypothetical protein